jgi:hypothetical protein
MVGSPCARHRVACASDATAIRSRSHPARWTSIFATTPPSRYAFEFPPTAQIRWSVDRDGRPLTIVAPAW